MLIDLSDAEVEYITAKIHNSLPLFDDDHWLKVYWRIRETKQISISLPYSFNAIIEPKLFRHKV